MTIDNKFEIGQEVYLKTDKDQNKRIVVGIEVTQNNTLCYILACECTETSHFDFEIMNDRDILLSLN